MDLKILKVKSFNLLLIFLISIILILLIMTSILFLSLSVNSEFPVPSLIAAALLSLFCVPICIVIYLNNKDKLSKRIFLALSLTFFLNTISGILVYVFPFSFNSSIIDAFGKTLMILSYLPVIYALYVTYKEQNKNIHYVIKIFIFYICLSFIILSIYYTITQVKGSVDTLSVLTYSIAMILDIIIVALTAILILINLPTNLRYLFSIIFGFYSFSFIGDSLNLLKFSNIYFSSIDAQYFYDLMCIFAFGTLLIYSLSNIKITTIEEVNKKLKDTSLVVEDLIMQSPDAMCMINPMGDIIKANNLFIDIFNINNEIETNIFKLNINEDIKNSFEKLKNGEIINLDYVKEIKSDQIKFLSLKLYPTYTSDKKISNYIIVGEDITKRKNAEDALKNANDELENRVFERTAELSQLNAILQNEIREHKIDEDKIKSSLKEKDVLLKEIHHRVKNNMQIISSMLGLQSSYIEDKRFNEMLKDSQDRIKSMALIHEKLYQSNNLAYVNFPEYVNSLISNITHSYSLYTNKIKINTSVDNISFNIDTAIPLGLIINELVSNSYKHAFKSDMDGIINLEIKSIENNHYIIKVQDNGLGFPPEFDINKSKSLGLQLVRVLVEQIDGQLSIKNENGLGYIIEFESR